MVPAEPNCSSYPKSYLAIESYIVSLICAAAWVLTIVLGAVYSSRNADLGKDFMILVVFILFVIFASNVVGLIFGIIACTKKNNNKRTAVKGIIINGIQISLIAFVLLMGQITG